MHGNTTDHAHVCMYNIFTYRFVYVRSHSYVHFNIHLRGLGFFGQAVQQRGARLGQFVGLQLVAAVARFGQVPGLVKVPSSLESQVKTSLLGQLAHSKVPGFLKIRYSLDKTFLFGQRLKFPFGGSLLVRNLKVIS